MFGRDWVDKNLDARVLFTGDAAVAAGYEQSEATMYTKLAARTDAGGHWRVDVKNQTKINQLQARGHHCEKVICWPIASSYWHCNYSACCEH